MHTTINRDEVHSLADEGAVLAEVLPRPEFDWAHLPGAIHLPYKHWDPRAVQQRLDRDQPIVVYCHDFA